MTITVQQIGPESFEPASELLRRFFAEEGFTTPPGQIRSALREMLDDASHAVFIARRESIPVGVATAARGLSIELGHYAEIEDLYVLPAHRKIGIAAALMDAALAWSRSQHCALVIVTVTPEGEAAHDLARFYGRFGFQETGRAILARQL